MKLKASTYSIMNAGFNLNVKPRVILGLIKDLDGTVGNIVLYEDYETACENNHSKFASYILDIITEHVDMLYE